MFSKSVLITGANRGIGLEFVYQLISQTKVIFAACRKPNEAKKLQELATKYSSICILEVDVRDESSIKEAAAKVSELVGDDGLNVLINNAGILVKNDKVSEQISSEVMRNTFETNIIGPTLMCKHFIPLLKKASEKFEGGDGSSCQRAAVINMGSYLGSFSTCNTLTYYSYAMSKAALHMFSKNLSNELASFKILSVSIHPGAVQTDMGGPTAAIEPKQSVKGMLRVISGFNEKHNGTFWDHTGEPRDW